MMSWFGFARPSGRTAIASAPQMSFAPLSPKRCQRRRISSVTPPVVVPSQPSIGWMATRLPMRLPLTVTLATGCASGDSVPTAMASSHGNSMPSAVQCARKSATVFSDGIRVSFKGSGIKSFQPVAAEVTTLILNFD